MNSRKKLIGFLIFVGVLVTTGISVYFLTREESVDMRSSAESADAVVDIFPFKENWTIDTYKNYGVNIFSTRYELIFEEGGESEYNDFLEIYKDFGFKTLRFPNGCHIAWYNWKDPASSSNPAPTMEQVMQFSNDSRSEIVFEMSTLGFLDPSIRDHKYTNPCGNEVEFRWTEDDIRWFVQEYTVKRKSQGKNYIKYYELGNEEWGYYNHNLERLLTPEEYVAAAKQVSEIIRDEAPYVEIIGVSTWDANGVWGKSAYNSNAEYFDAVTIHGYWHDSTWPDAPEGESLITIDLISSKGLDAFIEAFEGVEKFQAPAYTEWNLFCWNKKETGDPHRNAKKFEHTLYILEHLLMQSEYNIRTSNYHEMHPVPDEWKKYGGCNLIYKDGDTYKKTAAGIGYDAYVKHYAPTHVKTVVDSPIFSYESYGFDDRFRFQSLYASSAKDGDKVHSIIINRNNKDVKTRIDLKDYSDSVKYDLYLLTAPALSSEKEEITFIHQVKEKITSNGFVVDIPKHSAIVLEISKHACVPNCSGKTCGESDGCGGKCTNCPSGKVCNAGNWKCEEPGTIKTCSVADIGGSGGSSDGKINGFDLSIILTNWKCTAGVNCEKADIWGKGEKKDGKVNGFDLTKILSCWKK